MAKMRPFTKEDWYGWAGAEETPECPAMIGEAMVEGHEGQIICDLHGVEIHWSVGDWDDPSTYRTMVYRGTYFMNRFIAENLYPLLTEAELINLGFVKGV